MQNNLKNIRKTKKLTQTQLADLCDTSMRQIQFLEKGERKLSPDWLEKLSSALDCNPTDILPDLAGSNTLPDWAQDHAPVIASFNETERQMFDGMMDTIKKIRNTQDDLQEIKSSVKDKK
ncbi:MAG: helix-turn-helix domain-containing protein [Alphaproteobacteria bacterium]